MSPRPTDMRLGITQAYLKQRYAFDATRGVFLHTKGHTNGMAVPGQIAGFQRKDGYQQIKIKARAILTHRLVWFWMTGEWPEPPLYVDHINGRKNDNRFENLRLADKSTNHRNNFIANRNNLSTGARCVHIKKPRGTRKGGQICVATRHRGKVHYLGSFPTVEAASAARDKFVLDRLPGKRGAINRKHTPPPQK